MPFFFTYAKVKDMSEPEYKPYSIVCNGNQLFTQELKETENFLITKDGVRYSKENHLSDHIASRTEKVGIHKNFYRVYPQHHKIVTQLQDRERKRLFKTRVLGAMQKDLSELSYTKAKFLNSAFNLGIEVPVLNSEQPAPTYSSQAEPWEFKNYQHSALMELYNRNALKVGAVIYKGTKVPKDLSAHFPKSQFIVDSFMLSFNQGHRNLKTQEDLGLLKNTDYESLERLVGAWFERQLQHRVKSVINIEHIRVTQEMIDHFEKVNRGRE